MANPIYARLQATAQRLIGKYGQAGTVTRLELRILSMGESRSSNRTRPRWWRWPTRPAT